MKRTRGGEDVKNDVAKWQQNENGPTCEDGYEIKTGAEKCQNMTGWWTDEEEGEDGEVEESVTGGGGGGEGGGGGKT